MVFFNHYYSPTHLLSFMCHYVTFGLHFHYADTSDCLVSFLLSFFPPLKPVYDMIWFRSRVQYDLVGFSCTIRSSGDPWLLLYNINLRATHTTIPSTRGVQIPIDLVSSTTDSIRRCVVLFKPVRIPTSDPKSEFLCQSSLQLRRTYRPPEQTP